MPCFTLYLRALFQAQAPFYLEGRFNGGFFALQVWGGLHLEGLIFGILRYLLVDSGIWKFLLVECRILGFGIRHDTAQRIRNPTKNNWHPKSKFHWQRIQNPRLSWIPLHMEKHLFFILYHILDFLNVICKVLRRPFPRVVHHLSTTGSPHTYLPIGIYTDYWISTLGGLFCL